MQHRLYIRKLGDKFHVVYFNRQGMCPNLKGWDTPGEAQAHRDSIKRARAGAQQVTPRAGRSHHGESKTSRRKSKSPQVK